MNPDDLKMVNHLSFAAKTSAQNHRQYYHYQQKKPPASIHAPNGLIHHRLHR